MVSAAEHDDAGIDVVLRIHDPARMAEFDRAVFSVVRQSYRPVRLIVVAQRFAPADLARLEQATRDLTGPEGIGEVILNFTGPEPKDARSALLNAGIAAATGRYVAFLDYDDIVYHQSYAPLIGQLRAGQAAIAFGRIAHGHLRVFPDYLHCSHKDYGRFTGRGLLDLFARNFCPVHSFVIDRQRVAPEELRFEENLTRGEDYDFLIRLCARYPSDFSQLDRTIGEYFMKDDGSNTVLQERPSAAAHASWLEAEEFLQRRRESVVLSDAVKAALGLAAAGRMTVLDLLRQRTARA